MTPCSRLQHKRSAAGDDLKIKGKPITRRENPNAAWSKRQAGWAAHLHVGLPDHADSLREHRAGCLGLLPVCRPPACRTLVIHGHLLGGHGRG